MAVNIDASFSLAVFLVAIRLGALFLLAPIFAGLGGLVTVRVLLTLGLSAVFVASNGVSSHGVAPTFGAAVLGAVSELMVGGVLAFGLFAAFGAFSIAGKVLDIQSGFGIGGVYDPVTHAGAAIFSTMLNMLGVVVFFSMDGHHAFLRGIAFSLQQIPPGAGLAAIPIEAMLRQFGLMFSLGVALVIPVVLCLLLVEVGLAVISRVLPQMNVFIVMAPVKVFAGILLFALTVGTLAPVMSKVFASIFRFWEQVLL